MSGFVSGVKHTGHNLWRWRNVGSSQLLLHSCSWFFVRNRPPRLDFAATCRFGADQLTGS
jgi:hypothetical protein